VVLESGDSFQAALLQQQTPGRILVCTIPAIKVASPMWKLAFFNFLPCREKWTELPETFITCYLLYYLLRKITFPS
jgi:hypothetical protein